MAFSKVVQRGDTTVPDVFADLEALDRKGPPKKDIAFTSIDVIQFLRLSPAQQFQIINRAWDRIIATSYRRATEADFGIPEQTHKVAAARMDRSPRPSAGMEPERVSVYKHKPAHGTQQPNKLVTH